MTREAKIRGYKPGRFSFNVKGGRCEYCRGQGTKKIEMHFLPDVYVTCQSCRGSRYNPETLQVTYKGKNIADVLAMRIDESLGFFSNFPKITRVLQTLAAVGMGYTAGNTAALLINSLFLRRHIGLTLSGRTTALIVIAVITLAGGIILRDVSWLPRSLWLVASAALVAGSVKRDEWSRIYQTFIRRKPAPSENSTSSSDDSR